MAQAVEYGRHQPALVLVVKGNLAATNNLSNASGIEFPCRLMTDFMTFTVDIVDLRQAGRLATIMFNNKNFEERSLSHVHDPTQ
jgi:hypothetical protein